jgi:D-glycero-D-manno-heptose 1,7-bisphosphate phosphatase
MITEAYAGKGLGPFCEKETHDGRGSSIMTLLTPIGGSSGGVLPARICSSPLNKQLSGLRLIEHDWTLFLDRDGVINYEKHLDYIYNYKEFIFYEGVLESLKTLSLYFSRIMVVTNQRGVGKGLMSEEDLSAIHEQMLKDVYDAGGRIDAVYYCTALENNHPNRKPNPGMALNAQHDFAEIDFNRSIMVGDSLSDMEFGRNTGMYTVYLKTTKPDQPIPHPAIDLAFNSLRDLAEAVSAQ